MAEKKTKGRQKIEMKRIENEDDRLITFSKRRSGIYKKASELVTLTGAEVGVVVFSPSGKPFSFGHPSIEAVANRFIGVHPPPNDNTHPLVEAHRQVRIDELNQLHNELLRQLDAEKERGKILKQMTKGKETQQGWWEAPIEELNLQQLLQMNTSFDELHKALLQKLNEKDPVGASSSVLPPMNPGQAQAGAANPFAPNPDEFDPSGALPFSYGFKPGQL
ncbi:putative Mads box protein [Melia azedarach]|uniref:Mads box protein n=1 Tax=Melia azedarach TaxID=155640 RepID=A0ACC1WXQ5_MELAZ|nr:putative Mads box protein [Melia azedarach]